MNILLNVSFLYIKLVQILSMVLKANINSCYETFYKELKCISLCYQISLISIKTIIRLV